MEAGRPFGRLFNDAGRNDGDDDGGLDQSSSRKWKVVKSGLIQVCFKRRAHGTCLGGIN